MPIDLLAKQKPRDLLAEPRDLLEIRQPRDLLADKTPFFLKPFKVTKEEAFGKRYIPGITEARPLAVTGAKGLEFIQRTYGGLTRAITEPEKEKGENVKEMIKKAFRRGFEEPEKATGLFGGEITEFGLARDLPPAAAIALGTIGGTAADIGLGYLAGETIKGTAKVTTLSAQLLGKTVKRGVGLFGKPPTKPIITAPPSVQKVTQALKEAKPIRELQERLYTAERGKRVAEVVEAGKIGGEKGYFAQLKALKGQLLDEETLQKVQFEGIRGKLSQTDIEDLFNIIEASKELLPLEKVAAKNGLTKLLGAEGGVTPVRSQLKLLSQVFPEEFIDEVLRKAPLLQKMGTIGAEIANVPRAVMASFDMSMPFRQGIFLIRRQKQFAPAFRDMFKYFFNERSYEGLMDDIAKRPNYSLMRDAKLQLTKMGGALTQREEAFMGGKYAERLPFGIGKVVRMSNRAATGFLNKLRADVFDDLVNRMQRFGLNIEAEAPSLARYINVATGRGTLESFERAAVSLNTVFFSPRLVMSRLQLLNPQFYIKLSPFVRKEALKDLFGFAATATTLFSLAKMGGADVGTDPRSADFGKIKIGNTRFDILGGFQQYIRLAAQLITGEHISSTTGVRTTVGEGYKPLTRLEIFGRFIETKEAPVLSFVTSLLKGKGFAGRELSIPKEVALRFIPMAIQDMYDLWMERGFLKGTFMATSAFFGIGIQTYSPNAEEVVRARNSVIIHARELIKKGRIEEAQKLLDNNKEILQQGIVLSPFQNIINLQKKTKEKLEDNVLIPEETKNPIINRISQDIKARKKELEEGFKLIKKQQEKQRKPRDLLAEPRDLLEGK